MLSAAVLADKPLIVDILAARSFTRTNSYQVHVRGAGPEMIFEGNLIDNLIFAIDETSAIAQSSRHTSVIAYTNEPVMLTRAYAVWKRELPVRLHVSWSIRRNV